MTRAPLCLENGSPLSELRAHERSRVSQFSLDRLAVILADFAALTAYAVYHYGYLAFFQLHAMNAIQIQIFIDLVIALTFVLLWMVRDARERGIPPTPYVVLTLTLGSIGPLLYAIRRQAAEAKPTEVFAPAAAGRAAH